MNAEYKYKLRNGVEIPCIGYGTAPMAGRHKLAPLTGKAEEEPTGLPYALQNGYRLIDTAWAYKNEEYIGEVVRRSGIDRKEIVISSKCSNRFRGYERALQCFKDSLSLLKMEYLDLYLIHWPAKDGPAEEWQKLNSETWRALETLYKDGYIRAIGVSNFWPKHLQPLMDNAEIQPMVLQLEYHPGYMQPEAVEFGKKHGMLVEAYSPFGEGKLLGNETLKNIGEKYGKTPAQVILNWCIGNGVVPLPKSDNPQRVAANYNVFDFALEQEDIDTISAMEYFGGSGWTPDTITW